MPTAGGSAEWTLLGAGADKELEAGPFQAGPGGATGSEPGSPKLPQARGPKNWVVLSGVTPVYSLEPPD